MAALQIDLERATQILLQGILDLDTKPSKALLMQAAELGLEIVKADYSLGGYYGMVVGQDEKSWLVKYRSSGAVVLNFDEIEDGAVVPRLFDDVLMVLRHGVVTVTVNIAERNLRADRQAAEGK